MVPLALRRRLYLHLWLSLTVWLSLSMNLSLCLCLCLCLSMSLGLGLNCATTLSRRSACRRGFCRSRQDFLMRELCRCRGLVLNVPHINGGLGLYGLALSMGRDRLTPSPSTD